MSKTKAKEVTIAREGNQILLPPGMSYKDAREWLTRQETAEEQTVQIGDIIECFPLDGIVALARTLKKVYGFTEIGPRDGFWGPQPPVLVQVPTADGMETAPLGKLMPPKWEGGFLTAQIAGPRINIGGLIKRKFESEVKNIVSQTRETLASNSIYRGQATSMDLGWYNDDPEQFDIAKHSPKFMHLGEANLLLNRPTQFMLETSVYMLIERTQECLANKIALKHGALFRGKFGTGKTMAAKVVAKKCVANKWSFIYLTDAEDLANGLRIAKMYAPAVVFAEDIDRITGERDDAMNELLNVIDGVDTKDAPIITILTTNNPRAIDPSFLRAGRIDTVVNFAEPDAETAARFVKEFAVEGKSGASLLRPGEDLVPVGKALNGLVPAFICEAVAKAKRYAIYRTGSANIIHQITADDLCQAALAVREHLEMMETKGKTTEQLVAEAVRNVSHYGLHGELLTNGEENLVEAES